MCWPSSTTYRYTTSNKEAERTCFITCTWLPAKLRSSRVFLCFSIRSGSYAAKLLLHGASVRCLKWALRCTFTKSTTGLFGSAGTKSLANCSNWVSENRESHANSHTCLTLNCSNSTCFSSLVVLVASDFFFLDGQLVPVCFLLHGDTAVFLFHTVVWPCGIKIREWTPTKVFKDAVEATYPPIEKSAVVWLSSYSIAIKDGGVQGRTVQQSGTSRLKARRSSRFILRRIRNLTACFPTVALPFSSFQQVVFVPIGRAEPDIHAVVGPHCCTILTGTSTLAGWLPRRDFHQTRPRVSQGRAGRGRLLIVWRRLPAAVRPGSWQVVDS